MSLGAYVGVCSRWNIAPHTPPGFLGCLFRSGNLFKPHSPQVTGEHGLARLLHVLGRPSEARKNCKAYLELISGSTQQLGEIIHFRSVSVSAHVDILAQEGNFLRHRLVSAGMVCVTLQTKGENFARVPLRSAALGLRSLHIEPSTPPPRDIAPDGPAVKVRLVHSLAGDTLPSFMGCIDG